jgi:hypothetical protein
VAFEGFRRAAVPAAALLSRSTDGLRRLVEDSLLGAARLSIPVVAAMYAALPVVPLLWPKWASAVVVGQLYLLGFGIGGLASASLVPAAVARRGASVVVAEQLTPMVVGWLGLVLLRVGGYDHIGWVILPMYLAQVIALWRITEPAIRPRWLPELNRLLLALGAAVLCTSAGQLLRVSPIGTAFVAAGLFALVADLPRMLARVWSSRRMRSA